MTIVVVEILLPAVSQMSSLADLVRRRISDLGTTQDAVARRAGISRQGLVKLLSGDTHSPRVDTMRRLAGALRVNPIYLFQLLFERSLIEQPMARGSGDIDDHAFFVEDVTIPNGLILPPGHRFEKIWRIQNGGIVAWRKRRLRCITDTIASESAMLLIPDCDVIEIPDTPPGAVIDLAMWFTAPSGPCTCISEWKMEDADACRSFPDLQPLNCVVTVSST